MQFNKKWVLKRRGSDIVEEKKKSLFNKYRFKYAILKIFFRSDFVCKLRSQKPASPIILFLDTSSENDKPTTSSEHRVFSRNRGKSPSSYQRPLKKIFDRKRLSPNNAFTRHLRRRWSSESDDDYTTSYIRPSKQKRNEEDLEKA